MHPDREALIAGIAADPDNDLRRLVFADWLEEHGEPERAEFIRLQIHCESARESIRAGDLFEQHARRWFAPFLSALDPTRDATDGYEYHRRDRDVFFLRERQIPKAPDAYIRSAEVNRGFLSEVVLRFADRSQESNLLAAFANEPVTRLNVTLSSRVQMWGQFSSPALKQVSSLRFVTSWPVDQWIDAPDVFGDPNLLGVRSVALAPVLTSGMRRPVVPVTTVEALSGSLLGRCVADLTLHLDDAGLQALCHTRGVEPEALTITGHLTSAGTTALATANLAPHLRELTIKANLTNGAVADLVTGSNFSRLAMLDLSGNHGGGAGLRALAAAPFLPRLEVLSLPNNWYPQGEDLLPLAETLNPAVLRKLILNGRWDSASIPEFLTAKFGDRVVVA